MFVKRQKRRLQMYRPKAPEGAMERLSLIKLHKKYIANTKEKEIVTDLTVILAEATRAVQKACLLQASRIYRYHIPKPD